MRSTVTVEVPIPPSTNHLWRVVRHQRGRRAGQATVAKSRQYSSWLEVAVMLLRLGLPRMAGAVGVTVTIRGGEGWDVSRRDLDNTIKAVCDALVHAGRIPDDTTRFVTRIELRYTPTEPGRQAGCLVGFLDEERTTTVMTDVQRKMLEALMDEGDLVAGAQLMDTLAEANDPRASTFGHALGLLYLELKETFGFADKAKTKDENEWVGARWSEAAECSRAFDEFRRTVEGLFWAEVNDAHDIEDTTKRFQAALEFAATGEGEPTK